MKYDQFINAVTTSLYFGSLPSWQSTPIIAMLDEATRRKRSIEDTAYVLATAHHETGRFKYTHEIGKGRGRDYGAKILLVRGHYTRYYGRGHTQLTWLSNYAKMSVRLTLEFQREIDLVNNPEMAAVPEISAAIIWEGMIGGMFTGKNLADYIGPNGADYIGARRIVNGTDKAKRIAAYAVKFEAALKSVDSMKGMAA